jgi:O-antigen/teichoic acid export membrane protein
VSARSESSFVEGLRVQWPAIGVGCLGAAVLALTGVAGPKLLSASLAAAASTLGVFAPLLCSGALFAVLIQTLLARGRYSEAAKTSNLAVVVGIGLSVILLPMAHVPGLAAAELLMQLSACLWMLRSLKSENGS